MSRRDFIKLVFMGTMALLLPLNVSPVDASDRLQNGESSSGFDVFPLEDISPYPSGRDVRRILEFPVKSVEIIAPENPPWERIVVLAKV